MQKNAYKIKIVMTKSGERLPILFDKDGTIHYYANLYATVIIPFLVALQSRVYAACLSFIAGVMPPIPMFGRSLL